MTCLKRFDSLTALARASVIALALALAACVGGGGARDEGFIGALVKISTGKYEREVRALEDEKQRLLDEQRKLEQQRRVLTQEQWELAARINRKRWELHTLRRKIPALAAAKPAGADEISKTDRKAKALLEQPPGYDQAEVENLTRTIAEMDRLVSETVQYYPDD